MFKNKLFIIFFALILNYGCNKPDPTTGEVRIIEPNPDKKAREFADKGGGIFGDINNKRSSGNNFEFASSNVLWRATLQSLDFLPLLNADYSGGIIVYDWYSQENDLDEQIKITIRFLNNDLKSESIKITSHKKKCTLNEKCKIILLDDNFSNKIKENIITTARSMKILDLKKENK